jgi:hypothetical protein
MNDCDREGQCLEKDDFKLLGRVTSISGLFLLASGIYAAFYVNLGLNNESETLMLVGCVLILAGIYYFSKAYPKEFEGTLKALEPDNLGTGP